MALLLLAAAITLGGASRGGLGEITLQLLALLVLVVLIWRGASQGIAVPQWRLLCWLVASVLALPILQLLPTPTWLWQQGALRQQVAEQMRTAGVPVVSPLAIHAQSAERALWSLLPALAMLLLVWQLSHRRRRSLLMLLVGLAVISVMLGLAQLADGPDSALRPYLPTNRTDAVGFFANRNHYAALLVVSLPFAIGSAVWTTQHLRRVRGGDTARLLQVTAWIGVSLLLILGIAMSRSRAGLLLGMLAVLLMLPVLYTQLQRRGARRVIWLIVLAGLVGVVQFALLGILQRLQNSAQDDGRWTYAQVLVDAAADTAPFGSGLGSFGAVYPQYEAALGVGPGYAIVNHAHNDYAELWLEGGWPFLLCLAAFALAFVRISIDVWRPDSSIDAQYLLMRRLAWLGCILLLAHSGVDYPLRSTAMSVVFGMVLGMALAPAPAPVQRSMTPIRKA